MKLLTAALALILLILTGSPAFAVETIIGTVRLSREFISADLSEVSTELYPSDIMLLDVDNREFVDEIEVRVSLPRRFSRDPEITIAALVYGNLEEVSLDDEELSTRGRRLHFEPLVDETSTTIRLPVRPDAPLRSGGGNRVEIAPSEEDYPIAITALPVGKGLPSDIRDHPITVTAVPVSRGVGELALDLRTRDGNAISFEELENAELEVDDRPRDPSDLYIAPGFYSIRLRSEQYEEITATAAINEGETSEVQIELSQPPAKLFIDAPRGTQVFINGSFVPRSVGTEIELEPGYHELSYHVGGRPVTRTIELAPGTSYTATLDMSIDMLETDSGAPNENNGLLNAENE